tara:strand:+ start:7452 stop:8402 length:951 start_codon:yes stop_codon:yes gene_type:complete
MEEIKQDTPQTVNTALDVETKAFGAPADEGSSDNLTVSDAFFNDVAGTATETPKEGTPEVAEETPQESQPYEAKNDDKRFEYWQSQAAKRENELSVLQQQLAEAKAQPAAQPEVPAQQTQPATQEFPPPPTKPERPRGFSRDEAWSDPNSESARYLDEVESWRDDMSQYSDLKHQYDLALMQEKLDNQEEQRQSARKQYEARQQAARQTQQIYEHVQGHYGFNDTEAKEFIQTMSNPKSITMDNLVNLYRMQKGMASQQPNVTASPSDTFNQTQNAQQIPSPMGVVTGESSVDTRSDSDQIMDDLINSHKSKNPWT